MEGWFSASVPVRLRDRVGAIVRDHAPNGDHSSETLLGVAVDATRRLLEDQGTDRTTALDLLAVDALATLAMELMAEHPAQFEARCLDALRTLSDIPRRP